MASKTNSVLRGRLYYGWTIVAVGFVIEFMIVSLRFIGFSIFIKPMSQDLGLSRALLSGVISLSTLVDGLVSPFIGPIIDRRGSRGVLIFGAIVAGAGLIALGFVQGIWDFYLTRGVIFTVGIACAGPVTISVAISNWFIRKRGKAIAGAILGVSLGGAVLSPIAAYLIATYGWRMAWVVLGLAGWVVAVPMVFVFMKRRPEDIGLLPDGDKVGGQGTGVRGQRIVDGGSIPGPLALTAVKEETWTRREAMRTPALWLTIVAFGLSGMGSGATGVHFFAYLSDIGLSDASAAIVYSVYALSIFVPTLPWGIFIDKYPVRYCGMAVFAFLAVSLSMLSIIALWPSLWLIYLAAILLGCGLGGLQPVQEVLWASYFGRFSLGAVRSIASPFSIISSAGGPLFAGWVYDMFGSYMIAWIVFTIANIFAIMLFYLARSPMKMPQVDAASGKAQEATN